MKTLIFGLLGMFMCLSSSFAADKFDFDKDHTTILFFVSHDGYSNVVGRFTEFDGQFHFDEANPDNSSVEVSIDMASVDVAVPKLNERLKGEAFFNVEKYPQAIFKSTSVKMIEENVAEVNGEFTMVGQTHPVRLIVKLNKVGESLITKKYTVGFTAIGDIDRKQWGMPQVSPTIADQVQLHIETEVQKVS